MLLSYCIYINMQNTFFTTFLKSTLKFGDDPS